MGQLNIQTHWERLILPSSHALDLAETELTRAHNYGDADAVKVATYDGLRLGMTAAMFVYHFHEVVLDRKSLFPLPAGKEAIRAIISGATSTPNGDARPDDHRILGEVANAVKHAELRDPNIIHVNKRGRVLAVTENAQQVFAEGKPGGTPQVVILTHMVNGHYKL